MDITVNQLIWVRQHGGRFLSDVIWKAGEAGIIMSGRKKEEIFYPLPDNDRLVLVKRLRGTKEYPRIIYSVKEK